MSCSSSRWRAASLLALIVALIAAPYARAAPFVFSGCGSFMSGIDTSVVSQSTDAAQNICRVASTVVEALFATGGDEVNVVIVDGETVSATEANLPEDVAFSTSSIGAVPFSVIGGDRTKAKTPGAGVITRRNPNRPQGPWVSILGVDVEGIARLVYGVLKDPVEFFRIGFKDLGVTSVVADEEGNVIVSQPGGKKVKFKELDRNDDARYHVQKWTEVNPNVFPGFDLTDSVFYVQVSDEGFFSRNSNIEVGWRPGPNFEAGGDLKIGARLLENLLFRMLLNFEEEFGIVCDAALNVRTIEGTCNNLGSPEQGEAGSALRRLGGGIDPAFPNGDISIPSGPSDVKVRDVSNALFATSPGDEILLKQAKDLSTTCISTENSEGTEFVVCPFRFVKSIDYGGYEEVVPFKNIFFNECEDLVFRFESKHCTIDILLRCSGERELQLAEDPRFAETNRLLDPAGCTLEPAADDVLSNLAGLTDLFFTFAQFIDHDYGLSPLSQISPNQPGFSPLLREEALEIEFPIEIPDNDFHFEGREELEFTRAEFSEDVPNSQVNLHSSYLDASQIYGIDANRGRLIRAFEDGMLALSDGNLPPFNGFGFPGSLGATVDNGPNSDSKFFVAGDPRAQEQILLLMMHIIWLREHNRVAALVKEAYPTFDDEIIYQTARAIVTAEYQCIVYNEWLPLLLGKNAPKATDFVYDETLDATVSSIFTTATFRFGHSLVGTNLLRMGPGSRKSAQMELIPIRDAFFRPESVSEGPGDGVDAFMRGGAWHLCKELDHKVVDELRNFLIVDFEAGETDPPVFDLVSFNLQRGRDMGLPSLNDVRELFGLERHKSFSDFVPDPNLADAAAKVYNGDVDIVEPFFGLVEEDIAESQLGETFNTVIADQFRRSRDGDRFFYTGIKFDDELIKKIPLVKDIINHKVKLKDIIVQNTGVTEAELGLRETVFRL